MKRSEMLDLMWRKLTSESTTNETSMEKCERLLRVIEEAGMLPPPRYRDHDWNERGITYAQWIQEPGLVNEWSRE